LESPCPYCDRGLADDKGRELRPVDLRYAQVARAQQQMLRQLLIYGSAVAAVVSTFIPLLHLGTAIVVPLMVVAHLITVRLVLVRPCRQLLGATRRAFLRWMTRLSFLWLGIPGYGLAMIPLFGVVAGVATFAGLTILIHAYSLWSLQRERDRLPLTVWEKVVLSALILMTLTAFLLAIAVALAVGWSIAALSELIANTWG
jgi:hypothetical protein